MYLTKDIIAWIIDSIEGVHRTVTAPKWNPKWCLLSKWTLFLRHHGHLCKMRSNMKMCTAAPVGNHFWGIGHFTHPQMKKLCGLAGFLHFPLPLFFSERPALVLLEGLGKGAQIEHPSKFFLIKKKKGFNNYRSTIRSSELSDHTWLLHSNRFQPFDWF